MESLLLFSDTVIASAEGGGFLIKTLLNALALFAAAYLMRGVEIKDFWQAILVAVVLALLNATIGQILDFITMPLRLLTLGLFSFVVDALIIWIASGFFKGFKVRSFWTAIVLAVVLAIFNSILYQLYV
jgi:putative membrane protein